MAVSLNKYDYVCRNHVYCTSLILTLHNGLSETKICITLHNFAERPFLALDIVNDCQL